MKKVRGLLLALVVVSFVAASASSAEAGKKIRGKRPTKTKTRIASIKQPVSPFERAARDFKKLPRESRIAFVKAMRDFASQWEGGYASTYAELTPAQREEFAMIARAFALLFPVEEAWAGDEPAFNCLYGGWGSVSNPKCPSPSKTNDLYKRLFEAAKSAGTCKAGGFLCSPALFGPNLCLGPELQTADKIGSTYQNCRIAADRERRTIDQVADYIATNLDGQNAMAQVGQAMAAQCLTGSGENAKVKPNAPGMCTAAFNRTVAIFKGLETKYPDLVTASSCYDALDVARGCETPRPGVKDPRVWEEAVEAVEASEGVDAVEAKAAVEGCGNFGRFIGEDYTFVGAYRVKDKEGEVIIGTPPKSFFTNGANATELQFYKMTGATFTPRTKDVVGLVGVNAAGVVALPFWENRTTLDESYKAQLNEITLQMQERTAELRTETDEGKKNALKTALAEAVHDCAEVTDETFAAARKAACDLGITGDGCAAPSNGGNGNAGNGANEGR